jgi:hypothetical protein
MWIHLAVFGLLLFSLMRYFIVRRAIWDAFAIAAWISPCLRIYPSWFGIVWCCFIRARTGRVNSDLSVLTRLFLLTPVSLRGCTICLRQLWRTKFLGLDRDRGNQTRSACSVPDCYEKHALGRYFAGQGYRHASFGTRAMDISDKDLDGVNLDPNAFLYESSIPISPSHFLDAPQHQSEYPVMMILIVQAYLNFWLL